MNAPLSIRNQWCPNKACPLYSKQFRGNIVIHSQKQERMKCTACSKTWVTHRHEWNYRLRTASEKVKLAAQMLQQGLSIRKVAKEVGVRPNTVQEWKNRWGNTLFNPSDSCEKH